MTTPIPTTSEAESERGRTKTVNAPLKRGLEERHVQFISLGGTIGTGLFLGIGSALHDSGPLSLFLGYIFTSCAIWAMMQSLGEMTTWLPLPGMIAQLGSRFVDPAFGFAIGWTQWYNCAIAVANETAAAVVLVQFWNDQISVAAWISIILVVIWILNFAPVRFYGEAEFILASIKIVAILGLLILTIVIDLGGAPTHDRLGFRYWKSPYQAMKSYISGGATGRFLGLFHVLINAAFAFGGVEQVAVAAGETANPTKAIPKAIRNVFYRIVFFYVLGALAVGLLVPSNSDSLLHGTGAAKSPWVIGITNAGISVLPSIINAVIITSASSSANANIYTGSRYLYALAQQKQAPQIFLRTTKHGVPFLAVGITGIVGLLAYTTVSSGAANVFGWFSSIVATAYLITWTAISFSYTRFRKALLAQGISRNDLDFKAIGQPYTAWFAVVFFGMVIFFNGFPVFTHGHWSAQDFVSAYMGIPIFSVLYLGWKVVMKTKIVKISEIDLHTGRGDSVIEGMAVTQHQEDTKVMPV